MDGSRSLPLVSIIIPTYNHARYIGDAIQSIFGQNYPCYEIVVVDDGSKDNTAEVVAPFGDRIKYIRQENQGLSAARNTGIAASTGDLIGLLDADDMLEPDYLSVMAGIIISNPDVHGATCGYRFVDQRNQSLFEVQSPSIAPGKVYETLLDHNPFVPEALLLKRECYHSAGKFDTALRACEDWDMWLRITRNYKIYGTRQVLTRHRVLDGSMSSDPARMLKNRLAVANKHFGSEEGDYPGWPVEKRKIYAGAYRVSCIEYLQYGDQSMAFTCFQKMALVFPALLVALETYYELGLGGQEKGLRGKQDSIEYGKAESIVFTFLEKLFSDNNLPEPVRKTKTKSYAMAHFALGLISYASGDMHQARSCLGKAVYRHPGLAFRNNFLPTFIKAILGNRVLAILRKTKKSR